MNKFPILASVMFSGALLVSAASQASYVSRAEPNNSFATAQNLNPYFTTEFDADIENSTVNAHASVNAYGFGTGLEDYYSFSLASAGAVLLDIDYGADSEDSYLGVDAVWLRLFDSDGQLITSNDGASPIDDGSVNALDGRILASLGAGLYYAAVSANWFEEDGTGWTLTPVVPFDYVLHVSRTQAPMTTPLPAAAPLMLSGLVVVGAFVRRRKEASVAA